MLGVEEEEVEEEEEEEEEVEEEVEEVDEEEESRDEENKVLLLDLCRNRRRSVSNSASLTLLSRTLSLSLSLSLSFPLSRNEQTPPHFAKPDSIVDLLISVGLTTEDANDSCNLVIFVTMDEYLDSSMTLSDSYGSSSRLYK